MADDQQLLRLRVARTLIFPGGRRPPAFRGAPWALLGAWTAYPQSAGTHTRVGARHSPSVGGRTEDDQVGVGGT